MSYTLCPICGQQECPGHTFRQFGHVTTDNSAVIRALEAEIAEQARLLDMSASREAKLLARIKELENGP